MFLIMSLKIEGFYFPFLYFYIGININNPMGHMNINRVMTTLTEFSDNLISQDLIINLFVQGFYYSISII